MCGCDAYGHGLVVDLCYWWLNLMILRVFSDLNDPVMTVLVVWL